MEAVFFFFFLIDFRADGSSLNYQKDNDEELQALNLSQRDRNIE